MSDRQGRVPEDRESDWGELASVPGECDTRLKEELWQSTHARRVCRLANTSLALAVLSCPAFLFVVLYSVDRLRQWGLPFAERLTPHVHPVVLLLGFAAVALFISPVAIITGHMAIARARRAPSFRGERWCARIGVSIGYLNIIVPITLVALAYFTKGRPNQDMVVCENNLRRLEVALREYAHENRRMFPPLSSEPGVLMFSPEAIPPNHFLGEIPFTCPTIRYAKKSARNQVSDNLESAYDDQSYFYLGYAVLDDDDVEAFAKAYRKRIAEVGTFDDDIVVEESNGTRVFHRLSEYVEEVWRATGDPNAISQYEGREERTNWDAVVTADVPILIERDMGHVYTDWDGHPRVAHVIYLHSGLQMVETGTWPMTEKTQRILAELAEEAR